MKLNYNNFSDELKSVFNYIENVILKKYPSKAITTDYFLLSVIENEDCLAYKALLRVMFYDTFNILKETYYKKVAINNKDYYSTENTTFDETLQSAINNATENNKCVINSVQLLNAVIDCDDNIKKAFKLFGITNDEILLNFEMNRYDEDIMFNNKEIENKLTIGQPKIEQNKLPQVYLYNKKKTKKIMGEVEKNLTNLNNLAREGKINVVVENDDIINKIFVILQKKYKNNALLIGQPGVGKTATVMHIANMLINGDVPEVFKNKKLMKMDFSKLLLNTMIRGSFEDKIMSIVDDARNDGNYIFFIDDIHLVLGNKRNFGDIDILGILDSILMEKNIQFICTTTPKSYRKYIEENSSLRRKLQSIVLEPSDYTKTVKILNYLKNELESYHNVVYEENLIEESIKLCDRYVSNCTLPDTVIDLLDEAGARTTINIGDSPEIEEIKKELNAIYKKKEEMNLLPYKDYNAYDDIVKEEIVLKAELKVARKERVLEQKPTILNINSIKEIISDKTGVPIEDVAQNEKDRLKKLEDNVKKYVVGQDEAVNEVCKIIKKQRLGISNATKPPVFLFTGATGTGKTYLAKKIAEEIFGDEKYLVRFDMSEYADKMSVNKLYGSANGYVGYENGGQLTEAIKHKKHCVLLLDEIEKADEEVHNVFLQLFDEGRLTDNTGFTVDFKNVIIIMTSNVGSKELSARERIIGFVNNNKNLNKEIICKAIKNKFKPEFINRINRIIYFNTLNEENLKQIIKLEICNLEKRVNNAGYKFSDDFISDTLINFIYSKIDNFEYGAREINREIETEIEDRLMNYMLSHNIENGHTFTCEELGI